MAATGPQWGVKYTLTSPTANVAVFNDESSGSYVGILDPEQSSGLDSAEIRESATDRVEADGGVHGNFFFGRRPVVLGGIIRANTSTQRNERVGLLKAASLALRADATLQWKVDGGVETFIKVRRQQPLRVTGKGFAKFFQLALVAEDPRIYASTLTEKSYAEATKGVNQTITNNGDIDTPPVLLRITGPGTNFKLENNGQSIVLNTTIAAGHFVDLNPLTATAMLDGVTSEYAKIARPETVWWTLAPGNNTFKWTVSSGATAATKVQVNYRDAWQ